MRASLLPALVLVLGSPDFEPHGGQRPLPPPPPVYEPPPDLQPSVPTGDTTAPRGPISRGSGARPAGASPTGARPAGASPRPVQPAPVARNAAARTGVAQVQIDYTTWEYWWDFNKHEFLRVKDAVYQTGAVTGSEEFFLGGSRRDGATHSLRPSREEIEAKVLPALLAVLQLEDQRDLTTAAVIALGKATALAPSARHLHAMRSKLRSPIAVVRESAALAIGISRMPEAIEDMAEIARGTDRGRNLIGRTHVDHRMRAYACYALGLIGARQKDVDTKKLVYEGLLTVLESPDSRLDTQVAAVQGIRLVRPTDARRTYKDWKLVSDCAETLWDYFERDLGPTQFAVQSHIPIAIAEMVGTDSPMAGSYRNAFLDKLARGKSGDALITQSCAIALGLICRPDDREVSKALHRYYQRGKDQQTRFFALMSLARLGGEHNRELLTKALARGSKAIEKPWCALGLGVMAHAVRRDESADPAILESIGSTLHRELQSTKNDMTQSAIAIALGLSGYRDAGPDLRDLLEKYDRRDAAASYFALALGLLGDRASIEAVTRLAQQSERRARPLRSAATALAVLGNKQISMDLVDNLTQDRPSLVTLAATASALATMGDRRTIDGLLEVQGNPSITRLGRGYALVALGGVIDHSPLPWQASVATNLNYRALVATLADGNAGILDIL